MCLSISFSLPKLFWLRPRCRLFCDFCMSWRKFELPLRFFWEPKLLKLWRISTSVLIYLSILAEAALSTVSMPLLGDVDMLNALSYLTAKLGVDGLRRALFLASCPSINNWSHLEGDPSAALFLPRSAVLNTNGPFFAYACAFFCSSRRFLRSSIVCWIFSCFSLYSMRFSLLFS